MRKLIILVMSTLFVIAIGIFDKGNSYEKSIFLDSEVVVFYPQHEDDETLWASAAILKAIEEKGSENVYIVLVSYGTGINILKEEKYKNLTDIEKYEYREREFLAAVNQLGIKKENIILLPRIDQKNITSFELMEKVALDFENKYENVTHVAHTYKHDWHLQHLKNGAVIQSLYNSGKIKSAFYFVKPEYEMYIPNSEKIVYKAATMKDKLKIKNACME